MAAALVRAGRTVVVLEAGPDAPETRVLHQPTTSGDPLPPMHEARARAVGGTASCWNTVRQAMPGGKYVPLDPIDFVQREIIPHGGWPLSYNDLDPWYRAAHAFLGLAPYAPQDPPARHGLTLLPFGEASMSTTDFHWGGAEIYTTTLPDLLDRSPHATLLRHTTAVRLEPANTPTLVHWTGQDGDAGHVAADHVVLAGGAIENARMLLDLYRTTRVDPPYWLGRGFMEHPVDRSLTLVSRHAALSPHPGFYAFAGTGPRARLVGRIGLSDKLLRDEGLRNASLRLFVVRHRFLSRHLREFSHRLGFTPRTTYRVLLDLEQAPHPDNRVTLSDRNDATGRPLPHVHWQWRPDDEAFRRRVLAVIQREFARADAGQVLITEGVPLEHGVHHHTGTTRMHNDPAHGVVDSRLRVHSHPVLHVVGGSVFPTCGVANPTLTIVALALRLADQLARG